MNVQFKQGRLVAHRAQTPPCHHAFSPVLLDTLNRMKLNILLPRNLLVHLFHQLSVLEASA